MQQAGQEDGSAAWLITACWDALARAETRQLGFEIDRNEFEAKAKKKEKLEVLEPTSSSVNALTAEMPPDALLAVSAWKGQDHGWACVKTVMDSGAVDSVAPSSMAPGVAIQPSPGSQRGQNYLSASNERIPNLGQQTLAVRTEEGVDATATFQIADVARPLNSVGKMCDLGKRVMFGKKGGVIWDIATGHMTKFRREADGVYELNLWMKEGSSPSGFTWPGK